MKIKGYLGHVKVDEKWNVVEKVNVSEELAGILKFNVEKGNEEARELGFKRMNGFAMMGSKKSLAFMKGEAIMVETSKADWQELFVHYVYMKGWLALGIALLVLSVVLYYMGFATPYLDYFAPLPRLYLPTILLLISLIMIPSSKTRYTYRL
ncbi:hypothetical protein L3N51_01234 [Metallosphaera sp. J1]|uniref:hypothetical protein n=1 Tax=Metallosphaera TaxID=41980 RepID=UPI001EDEA32E|nr:hypothetical protein [Metallosphaera javensis (ex Hofmann et al. 2022)]MCG3108944.1 hypothetical protein [Metallosphaera javensis (ex Hofmann et al. 2022)]BCS92298.1 MAG: hypothetical protein MjAS7_0906 [Metallosphaera javensis (ex Sakai et al. 2022)]